MREIFIFAQTRSGSTLLQRAINQTENVVIYGEHGGMLNGFADAYYGSDLPCIEAHSVNDLETLRSPKMFAPCLSCIEIKPFKQHMRNFLTSVLNPNPDYAHRWGFKEVRYKGARCRVFDMLVDLFPSAKFVFLVRDPVNQIMSIRSVPWGGNETFNERLYYWLDTFTFFNRCRKAHPSKCKMIEYANLRCVDELFNWLELDNRRVNLFRQMPRTGQTENKKQLTNGELSCLEELGLHDLYMENVWDL